MTLSGNYKLIAAFIKWAGLGFLILGPGATPALDSKHIQQTAARKCEHHACRIGRY